MSVLVECFWGFIPEKFRPVLIELYKTPYCTFEYYESFYNEASINCFSIFDGETPIHLILFIFDQQNRKIRILNRVINIDDISLQLFSEYIFSVKSEICIIQANHLINNFLYHQPFNYICKPFEEDYVINLHGSTVEYLSKLSPNMRRHSKYYISRIARTYGNYSFRIFEKKIPENIIDKIVEMNFFRMKNKNIESGIDKTYAEKIKRFICYYGFVSVLEINNEIVAGIVSYKIINNYYVEIISSDPKYDRYDVGHTCLFLTIQNCIDTLGKEFHLLWGNSLYKKRFLAERIQLYSITIYRSFLIKQMDLFSKKISHIKFIRSLYDYQKKNDSK